MHQVMLDAPYYRKCLSVELARRVESNPKYSVRGFARALKVDPSILSRVLRGERTLSFPTAQRITDRLNLSPKESVRFYRSLAVDKQRASMLRVQPLDLPTSDETLELENEKFRVISAWYHFAILDLTRCEDFQSDVRWIAGRLGLATTLTQLAVERLLMVGLLVKDAAGTLKKSRRDITTASQGLKLSAFRQHQRQLLEKSIVSLETDDETTRQMMGITMAVDPDRLALARVRIQEFSRELCRFLEGGRRRRVYRFQTGLFPLDLAKK